MSGLENRPELPNREGETLAITKEANSHWLQIGTMATLGAAFLTGCQTELAFNPTEATALGSLGLAIGVGIDLLAKKLPVKTKLIFPALTTAAGLAIGNFNPELAIPVCGLTTCLGVICFADTLRRWKEGRGLGPRM